MTRPYRGVAGYRRRDSDEPNQAREMTARFAGRCADTGAAIQPGDIIQRDAAGRTILVKSNAPRPR